MARRRVFLSSIIIFIIIIFVYMKDSRIVVNYWLFFNCKQVITIQQRSQVVKRDNYLLRKQIVPSNAVFWITLSQTAAPIFIIYFPKPSETSLKAPTTTSITITFLMLHSFPLPWLVFINLFGFLTFHTRNAWHCNIY